MTEEQVLELRRYLAARDVDTDKLPPFALSPKQLVILKDSIPAWMFPIDDPRFVSDGTLTVHGVRFVRSIEVKPQGD